MSEPSSDGAAHLADGARARTGAAGGRAATGRTTTTGRPATGRPAAGTAAGDKPRRVRLSPEERTAQIVQAATELVAVYGYHGLSLQDVADRVGISQAGLLHYVGTKMGLLELLIGASYDRHGTPQDFIASGDPAATHPDGVSFPAYLRYLVHQNSLRPQLMQLYMVLGTEAGAKDHPAHHYFVSRPDEVWSSYRQVRWRVPPQLGGFDDLRDLVEMCIEAMDGMQVRYFRDPPIDINDEWRKFEGVFFPSPLWDGFR